MSSMPKISLVTPNFNYAEFLESALRSVQDQGYENLEHIVLDGGSTDGSVEIIKKYAHRLAYWRSGRDEGQYQTITEGLNLATGEVLGWLNSDDLHAPWTLRAVGEVFAAFPEVDWISSLRPMAWDVTGICTEVLHLSGFCREAYLDGANLPGLISSRKLPLMPNRCRPGFIQQESTFWRRSLWEKAGRSISTNFGMAGDFDLWGRFFEHAELVGIGVPLAGFRLQHRQQSASFEKYAAGCAESLALARKRARWGGPSVLRRIVQHARAQQLPRVQRWACAAVGYSGKRIVRVNPAGPEPTWRLVEHRFL